MGKSNSVHEHSFNQLENLWLPPMVRPLVVTKGFQVSRLATDSEIIVGCNLASLLVSGLKLGLKVYYP